MRASCIVCLMSLGLVSMVDVADACSLALPDTLAGSLPENEAEDVPLNVKPVLVGNIGSLDVQTGDGDSVDFDVSEESQGIVVSFDEPLAPETEYVLSVGGREGGEDYEITFTTGTSTYEEEVPEVDGLQISGLTTMNPGYWVYMCSSPHDYLCVGSDVPADHILVVEAETENDTIGRMLLTPGVNGNYAFTNGFYSFGSEANGRTQLMAPYWDPESCVEIHYQNVAGVRGPATKLCPDDFTVHTPSSLIQIECDGGELSFMQADGDGESSGPGAPEPPPVGAVDAGAPSGEQEQDEEKANGDGDGEPTAPPANQESDDDGDVEDSSETSDTNEDASAETADNNDKKADEQTGRNAVDSDAETENAGGCSVSSKGSHTQDPWLMLLGGILGLSLIRRRR